MGCFNSFVWLSFTVSLFTLGILIFAHGFLLTRHEMTFKSSCDDQDTCWVAPQINSTYNRVVLIIVDALRFDFARFTNESLNLPYINKLPVLRDMAVEKGCSSVQLFRFQADAPTTTMQRIKGFTTGSFPTFIDISNNFDSSEITEDNIIDQIAIHHNISFLGDDTWLNLFPDRFKRAFPFPSFDVKDLHTVDNGIMRHLVEEIERKDWRVLIAHFLGVDHCGHRYGPLHPEMASKLNQMNEMLKSVFETVDDDTLVLVMGDHGMTQTGDHGGATSDEVNAALFVYSPNNNLMIDENVEYDENCHSQQVQQIDIVPTLSLLLGAPIPFSNLGTFISACSPGPDKDSQRRHLKEALRTNALQVKKYLREYNAKHRNFDQSKFNRLMEKLNKLDDSSADEMKSLLREAREMCREVWAQFDVVSMGTGLGCCVTFTSWLLIGRRNKLLLFLPTLVLFITNRWFYSRAEGGEDRASTVQIFHAEMTCIVVAMLVTFTTHITRSLHFVLSFCVVLFYGGMYTSNSFILSEDTTIMYLCLSMLFFVVLKTLRDVALPKRKTKIVHGILRRLQSAILYAARLPLTWYFCLSLFTVLGLRAMFTFRVCRPEQFWCYNADASGGISSESTSLATIGTSWRLASSSACLLCVVLLAMIYFKRCGNSRGSNTSSRICTRNLLPCAVLCIAVNWHLQASQSQLLDHLPDIYATFLPRCAYVLVLISALWWIVSPITAYLLYPDKHGRYKDSPEIPSEMERVRQCYRQLKKQFDKDSTSDSVSSDIIENVKGTPAAFGLYTVVTVAILGLGEVLVLLLAMLLDIDNGPVLLMFVVTTACLLELIATDKHKFSNTHCKASWEAVMLWSLSSSYWWFASGHQGSISSIPWSAAFVGFRGNHPTVVLPAVMVTSNVFASQILHTFLLPLIILWPIGRGRWMSSSRFKYDSDLDFIQSDDFWPAIQDLFSKHLTLHAVKMTGCMAAAFIHRRHIMVWQIFAPRFLYECLSFFVVCFSSLLTYGYLVRIEGCLRRWIAKQLS